MGLAPGQRLVRASRSLRRGFAATSVAMAAGDVSLTQARVIIRSVEDLPDDLGPGVAASGEAMMIGHCSTFAQQPSLSHHWKHG